MKEAIEKAKEAFDSYAGMGKDEIPDGIVSSLQVRLCRWQIKNFGGQPYWRFFVGMSEELGELARAILKGEQGIRGYDDPDKFIDAAGDAIGDLLIYTAQLCTALRLDMATLFQQVSEEVMRRDWIEDPEKGGTES